MKIRSVTAIWQMARSSDMRLQLPGTMSIGRTHARKDNDLEDYNYGLVIPKFGSS